MIDKSHLLLLVGMMILVALGIFAIFFVKISPEKSDRIAKRAGEIFDRFCTLVKYTLFTIFIGGFFVYTFWQCYEEQSFAPAYWIVGVLTIFVVIVAVSATFFGVWWLLKNFYRVLPLPGKAYRICRVFFSKLSDRQKICCGMSAAAVVLLFMAISSRWESGFYIFLRWVVCLALGGKLLEKFPAWFKFILIVGAIIYNPIAPIHIGDRNDWLPINWITLPIIVSAEIITIKKAPNHGTPKNS